MDKTSYWSFVFILFGCSNNVWRSIDVWRFGLEQSGLTFYISFHNLKLYVDNF